MAKHVRRHMAKVQLSIAAGALGLLAGVGLGKGTPTPSQVDAEPAAHNVITINGSNIRDGSVKFKDLDKHNLQKFIYLKQTANRLFLKKAAAADIFAKIDDVESRFIKMNNVLSSYIKADDADSRFVNGDGSVFTGSQLVGDAKETLLTVPNTLRVEASTPDGGKNATLTLTNLASVDFEYASTAPAQGGTQHGNLAPGTSTAILIGLLQPATVQVIPGAGDGGGVHTFTFTGYGEAGGQVQVVGQALSR